MPAHVHLHSQDGQLTMHGRALGTARRVLCEARAQQMDCKICSTNALRPLSTSCCRHSAALDSHNTINLDDLYCSAPGPTEALAHRAPVCRPYSCMAQQLQSGDVSNTSCWTCPTPIMQLPDTCSPTSVQPSHTAYTTNLHNSLKFNGPPLHIQKPI